MLHNRFGGFVNKSHMEVYVMNSDGLSASDVALLSGNNGNNNCGWGGDMLGMLALFFLFSMFGWGGFGGCGELLQRVRTGVHRRAERVLCNCGSREYVHTGDSGAER